MQLGRVALGALLLIAPFSTAIAGDAKSSGGAHVTKTGVDVDIVINTPPPPTLFATTTVNCPNGAKFEISTGDSQGKCTIFKDERGNVTGGICSSPGGGVGADCDANGGRGACGSSEGSGSCR